VCNLCRLKNVERWEIAQAMGADAAWRHDLGVTKDYAALGGPGYVVRRDARSQAGPGVPIAY